MQGADEHFIDLALGKIKAHQIPIHREVRRPHLIIDRTHLAFGDFGFEQRIQDRQRLLIGRRCLAGQIGDRVRHAEELQ